MNDIIPHPLDREIDNPQVEIVSNIDIEDLFGVPGIVHFQGCMSPAEYQARMDGIFTEFTAWVRNEMEGGDDLPENLLFLGELRLALDEALGDYRETEDTLTGVRLLTSHRVDLPAGDYADELYFRAALSEFLEIQRRTVQKALKYVDLHERLLHVSREHDRDKSHDRLIATITEMVRSMEPADGQDNPLSQKITWNGDAESFVHHFAPLINTRQIYLRKKLAPDADPIVRILHSVFRIPKARGDGDVSLGTLSTYFKQYNAAKRDE